MKLPPFYGAVQHDNDEPNRIVLFFMGQRYAYGIFSDCTVARYSDGGRIVDNIEKIHPLEIPGINQQIYIDSGELEITLTTGLGHMHTYVVDGLHWGIKRN